MRTSIACLCCSFLLSLPCSARDLTGYDRLGPLEEKPGDANDSALARTRDFVWQHWTEHRRGYAIVTRYSREGEASVFHFYIEPDADGQWQVAIDGEHERKGRPPKDVGKRWHESSHCVAHRVKRPRNYEGEYYFEFADAHGKTLSIW